MTLPLQNFRYPGCGVTTGWRRPRFLLLIFLWNINYNHAAAVMHIFPSFEPLGEFFSPMGAVSWPLRRRAGNFCGSLLTTRRFPPYFFKQAHVVWLFLYTLINHVTLHKKKNKDSLISLSEETLSRSAGRMHSFSVTVSLYVLIRPCSHPGCYAHINIHSRSGHENTVCQVVWGIWVHGIVGPRKRHWKRDEIRRESEKESETEIIIYSALWSGTARYSRWKVKKKKKERLDLGLCWNKDKIKPLIRCGRRITGREQDSDLERSAGSERYTYIYR